MLGKAPVLAGQLDQGRRARRGRGQHRGEQGTTRVRVRRPPVGSPRPSWEAARGVSCGWGPGVRGGPVPVV